MKTVLQQNIVKFNLKNAQLKNKTFEINRLNACILNEIFMFTNETFLFLTKGNINTV